MDMYTESRLLAERLCEFFAMPSSKQEKIIEDHAPYQISKDVQMVWSKEHFAIYLCKTTPGQSRISVKVLPAFKSNVDDLTNILTSQSWHGV